MSCTSQGPCPTALLASFWVLTFPHGDGQDGSPGLEAFHRAKSLGDRFSLRRSAETLRSPVQIGGRVAQCGLDAQRTPVVTG